MKTYYTGILVQNSCFWSRIIDEIMIFIAHEVWSFLPYIGVYPHLVPYIVVNPINPATPGSGLGNLQKDRIICQRTDYLSMDRFTNLLKDRLKLYKSMLS